MKGEVSEVTRESIFDQNKGDSLENKRGRGGGRYYIEALSHYVAHVVQ